MRAKEILTEGNLTPGEIFKHPWRITAFKDKLLSGESPFVDKNGTEYYPDSSKNTGLFYQLDTIINNLKKNPNYYGRTGREAWPKLSAYMKSAPGPDGESLGLINFSDLDKGDLTNASGVAPGKINVQPAGIGITANRINPVNTKPKDRIQLSTDEEVKKALDDQKQIRAGELYKVIATNEVLDQAGDLGIAIKEAAKQISLGVTPDLSKYDKKIQARIAVDAGEYLGILMMVYNTIDFPKKQEFLKFLQTPDFKNLLVIFPGEQNAALSDSYGVQNSGTGGTIMISSKGGMGPKATGAAPSLSGLRPSLEKRAKRIKPGNGLDFIQTMINTSPTALQGFVGLNWMAKYHSGFVPAQYEGLLPFTDEDMAAIKNNIATKGQEKLPPKFKQIFKIYPNLKNSGGTPGGKVTYAVTTELISIINESNAIPNFRTLILELLEENFVQIFTRVVGNKLVGAVLWPGKVDGNVSLATKISAGEPGKGGLGFKVTD
jgi:hypothetical protein